MPHQNGFAQQSHLIEHGHPDRVIVLGLPKTCLQNLKSYRFVSGFKKKMFLSIKMLRTLKSERVDRKSLCQNIICSKRVSKRSSQMPAASKKFRCHFWGQIIFVTEKPGCGNLEKYSFECTGVLIHAGWPKEKLPWWSFTRSG